MRLGAREPGDSEGRGGSVAKKFVLRVAILATLMLVLSSCARGGGGEGSKTVGYAGPTLNNAFFVGLQKGVRDGAKSTASSSRRPTPTTTRARSSIRRRT